MAFTLPLNQDGQMAKAGFSRLWDGGFWQCNQLLLKNMPPVYQEGHRIKQGEGLLREAEVLRQ